MSDLQGLPWAMSMEQFFEAWVETLMSHVARRIGGIMRSGRERQTVVPLNWDPPYLGSQKSLVPDIVIERDDTTVIVDAKYKEHWEEMQERRRTDGWAVGRAQNDTAPPNRRGGASITCRSLPTIAYCIGMPSSGPISAPRPPPLLP
jgi:McrBC 5-methylcytosine restriction system component